MRAIDDSSPKFAAVMRELLIWKQLPESDLSHLVPGFFLVTDDFREMEDQGLLTMEFIGDEYVLSATMYGRLWLEQYDSEKKEYDDAIH
ncbi:MAG TPA: hypothetical protein VJQ26_09925 [Ktedonobacteraceae bacterium]|jgi:hypothetical protein|nr:hypothetical protein [Ktedonobacteraceae bacterium]